MNKETLIKQWLNHNLDANSQKAFEQLEDYETLQNIDHALKQYKAPEFNSNKAYQELLPQLQPKRINTYSYILRIAAVLIIGLAVWQFSPYILNTPTQVNTAIAEQSKLTLPDQSEVVLNANSFIEYNKKNWAKKREVTLNGEAFFKVAKGKTFSVITAEGVIEVLGTAFNVKQRSNYFEVFCYEGAVKVTHKNNTKILKPNHSYIVIDGENIAKKEKENTNTAPSWLQGESHFKSVPLKHVIAELNNHYNITINTNDIDTNRVFTGSFTHHNLDLALKSVTLPLNLRFKQSKNIITLMRE